MESGLTEANATFDQENAGDADTSLVLAPNATPKYRLLTFVTTARTISPSRL